MKKIFITQRVIYIKKYNELRDSIDQNMISWAIKLNINPILVPNNLIKKKGELDRFIKKNKPHGLILTGGDDIGKFLMRLKILPKISNSDFFISMLVIMTIGYYSRLCRAKSLAKIHDSVTVKHMMDNAYMRWYFLG